MAYKPQAGAQMAAPNVIPMADIMLVLLIIFMVVTPLLTKDIPVDLASAQNSRDMQDADKDDAIVVAVTRDGIPNELPPVETLQHVFEAAGVSNSSRVVLYGERLNLFAARAYFTLDYLGVAARVALLDGGLEKWTAERRPLSTEMPQAKTTTLVVSPRPEILVDTKTMRDFSQKKPGSVALVDARPTKEFTGEQLSEDVAKAGHIPGAKGLFWMDMLVSRQNPVLKPEPELRRMYEQAHAATGQPLVTYCRTGMQSSFDYFVAKYLGYDPSMYDGS